VRKTLAKLIENEESGGGNVNLKIYMSYFKHAGLLMSILAFGSNILFQAASVGSNGEKSILCHKCTPNNVLPFQHGLLFGPRVIEQQKIHRGTIFMRAFTEGWVECKVSSLLQNYYPKK
jgi:hypothetical protein